MRASMKKTCLAAVLALTALYVCSRGGLHALSQGSLHALSRGSLHAFSQGSLHALTMQASEAGPDAHTGASHQEILTKAVTPPVRCVPVRNVYYLRVHKTGSSTLTTMLYRLAFRHHLNMVTVTKDPYPTGDLPTYLFRVPSNESMIYNIFAEHSSLDYEAARKILPADTRFIATVRSPFKHLQSIFAEWGKELRKRLHISIKDGVKAFLNGLYTDQYHNKTEQMRAPLWIKNRQARTFGLPKEQFDDETSVNEFLSKMDSLFDLVLVNELYDESLILLKNRFCWDMQDIVYTSQRVRTYKRKDEAPATDLVEIHKNYSRADYKLYGHFYDHLKNEIAKSAQFYEELSTFRELNTLLSDFCTSVQNRLKSNPRSIYQIAASNESLYMDPSPWGQPFNVSQFECAIMKLDTWVIRNLFKIKQNPQLCTSNKIKRQLTYGSVHMNIKRHPGVYVIQKLYCRPPHPRYGIPLEVLAQKDAYMFV